MDLFEYAKSRTMENESPLASRLRPTKLEEVVGQQHIVGKDKLLYRAIKLQLLHVLKGTDLAYDYLAGKFKVLERTEYIDLVADCLEHLDPSIVIHRVTGDGPKDLLIAPLWASRKREVLNLLHHRLKERQSFQGKALERV